jgi:hypothetical protein
VTDIRDPDGFSDQTEYFGRDDDRLLACSLIYSTDFTVRFPFRHKPGDTLYFLDGSADSALGRRYLAGVLLGGVLSVGKCNVEVDRSRHQADTPVNHVS